MSILVGAFAVLVGLSCAYWLLGTWGFVKLERELPRLGAPGVPEPARWPRVSLVIPACNEVDTLEAAVASHLAQDYPELEVVPVDDRSTDGTSALVDRLAAADARVKALHLTHLPEGWLGKLHALHRGAEAATGDWLLFALAPGWPSWLRVVRGVGTGMALATCALASHVLRRPLVATLAFPVGTLLFVTVLLRSGWLGWRRGGIVWRGTLYPTRMLRTGVRFETPF